MNPATTRSNMSEQLKEPMMIQRNRFRSRAMLLTLLLFAAPAAFAGGGGGGLPWETPLNRIAQSLTGPVSDCAMRLSGVSQGKPPPPPPANAAGAANSSSVNSIALLRKRFR